MAQKDTRITEKWEYYTDIITSYDGHEQRVMTRSIPRRYFTYDYDAMDSYQAQWLRGLLRMRQDVKFYFPMWHTPVMLAENYYAGQRFFRMRPEDLFSFRETEYVAVYRKDSNLQDVMLGIENNNLYRSVRNYFEDGTVSLYEAFLEDLNMKNTFLYPLRRCSVQPAQNLNYVFSNGTSVIINLEDLLEEPVVNIPQRYIDTYEEHKQLNPWKLPFQINGREVLTISPQWINDGDLSLSISKNAVRLDNSTGMFVYRLKNSKSYDAQTMEFYLMSRSMINNFTRFFSRIKGRFKSFYAPTWVNDLNVSHDINGASNFIYVNFSNLYAFYGKNTRRKKIIVFTKDGTSHIGEIMSYSYETINGMNFGRIALTNPLGVSIPKDRILMVSYMNLVRSDSDSLQFDFESDQVAKTTIIMKEVDDT